MDYKPCQECIEFTRRQHCKAVGPSLEYKKIMVEQSKAPDQGIRIVCKYWLSKGVK